MLMLPGFADVESWNEALVAGRWGQWLSGPAERLRRAVDMEHWPALQASLDGLLGLLARVAGAEADPAGVLLLGGDVPCSCTARAQLGGVDHPGTAVHQLVVSPFRDPLEPVLRWADRVVQRPVVPAGRWPRRRGCRVRVGVEGQVLRRPTVRELTP